MLAEGHKLAVGGDSMIGWAVANRQPRIAQNVGQEMVRFNNPHLPLTRSELALPIQIHESKVDSTPTGANLVNEGERDARVLGAMSIQSTQEAAFDQDDILILQSIADGLASAIENARLFTATQASLDEIRTLHRQYLEQAWQLEKARRGEIAYSFESGIPALAEPPPEGPLEVPIRLRDQVIGSLTLEPGAAGDSDDRSWSVEEMALVEAVTNQAALALENARLLDDTRRKVSLERSAASITSKLWASADIETILRTALQELGLSLGARDGRIELWPSGLGHRLPEGSAADGHPVAGAQTVDGIPATPQEELSGDNPVEDCHASD
jgi:GAF domain-containing protein